MNWTDDVLSRIDPIVVNQGYEHAARFLSEQRKENINAEQLRSARRRWLARTSKYVDASIGAAAIKEEYDNDWLASAGRYVEEQLAATNGHGIPEFSFSENKRGDQNTDMPRYVPEQFSAAQAVSIVDRVPSNGVIKVGAMGDTHLGSKYERIDLIEELYAFYADAGVTKVFHTGNWIEGESTFNQDSIHTHGLDNQILYFVRHYPKVTGITTYYISGDDHEGWHYQKGVNAGERLEDVARRRGRSDLVYLGYMEADIPISLEKQWSDKFIRVIHPGGGSAQAVSYTSQKIMANVEHDDLIPLVFFIGHYHKSEFLPNYRGAYLFQTGTFQEQSPFMRKKMLRADIGAWIVTLTFRNSNLVSIGGEFISFRKDQWRYK